MGLSRRSGAAGITVVSMVALSCAAPAWSADNHLADGNGFVTGGKKVDLSVASGDGTPLSPGLYSTTLPTDQTPRYITLKRGEGERMEVSVVGSAVWKDNAWSVDDGSQDLQLQLSTSDGTTCGTSSASLSSTTVPGLLSTTVAIDPTETARMKNAGGSDQKCRDATSYTLQVKRDQANDNATPMPLQIAVVNVPKVSGNPAKAQDSDLADMDTSPRSTSGEVRAGNGFANATTLTDGAYDFAATPGRRMFFRVHLGWGQRMSVGWQVPKNGQNYTPKQDLDLQMLTFDPALTPATMSGSASSNGYLFSSGSSDGSSKNLGVFTVPVQYGNADLTNTGGSDTARWHSMPGWYYVALDITPNGTGKTLDSSQTIPTSLSVRVQGTPQSGPQMDVSQPDPGTLSTVGHQSANPFLWGGALVAGLAAVAGLTYVLWRRNSTH